MVNPPNQMRLEQCRFPGRFGKLVLLEKQIAGIDHQHGCKLSTILSYIRCPSEQPTELLASLASAARLKVTRYIVGIKQMKTWNIGRKDAPRNDSDEEWKNKSPLTSTHLRMHSLYT